MKPPDQPILVEHLRATQAAERRSFHMPGHKGGAGASPAGVAALGAAAYAADLSELGGFDYLHGPESALMEAQQAAAELFGADRTWFLVNGATVGNLAALLTTVSEHSALLLARASHRSVYAGLELSGAHPVYLPPVRNDELDSFIGVDPEAVDEALSRNRHIRAVHVTSPSYYGFTIPVEDIAEICQARGVPLIVDEAHGTHFALHPAMPPTALASGADVVVHSPHKTLGSLTQSSLLHARAGRVDLHRLGGTLQILQSSSPSSLLLVSLDAAVHEAATHGLEQWGRALELAQRARDGLADTRDLLVYGDEIIGTPGIAGYDPTKLVVDVHDLGISGHAAARWLRERCAINPEFGDLRRLVFSITTGDSEETVDLLVEGLHALDGSQHGAVVERKIVSLWPPTVPDWEITPRDGALSKVVAVLADDAVGRISSEMIVPYPPGVPLLVAGELISPEVLDSMRQLLAAGCRMVGMSDPTGATLRCVDDS